MNRIATLIIAVALLAPASLGFSHCQIPCGIYGDETRFTMLEEHITTIEKSMNQINELSAAGDKNYNQLIRWVANKDKHADELTSIVTYYFMAQRVKPAGADDAEYITKITLLHRLIFHAMKAKQTTDLEHIEHLRKWLGEFRTAYFGEKEHAHLQEHHAEGSAGE